MPTQRPDVAVLLPDLRGGGTERVRLILVREFVRRGLSVDVVLMRLRGELLEELPETVNVVDLGSPRMRFVPASLRRYLARSRPRTLLVALWPLTGIACLVSRTLRSRPHLVVSEHNDFRHLPSLTALERFVLRHFGRRIYGLADRIVTVSGGVAESLAACAGLDQRAIRVIGNPIREAKNLEPAPEDAGLFRWWADAEVKLVAAGSLKKQKGFDVLFQSLAMVAEGRNVRLIVLGEGDLRGELDALAGRLGVSDRIRMPGFRRNPFPFFAAADLFVLSSRWEGLPGVLIEALGCGTPVVSTNCQSGPAEILADGKFGRLVPVNDPERLSEGILEWLSKSHDRKLLRDRAQVFSPAAAADQYLDTLFPDGTPYA